MQNVKRLEEKNQRLSRVLDDRDAQIKRLSKKLAHFRGAEALEMTKVGRSLRQLFVQAVRGCAPLPGCS